MIFFRLYYRHSYLLNITEEVNEEEEEEEKESFIDLIINNNNNEEGEYIFENLNKYSKYSFYLFQKFNSKEIKSNKISFQTPSDVPDNPPENFKIDILNATSIIIRWNSPPIDKCNGVIKGYRISIKENDKQLVSLSVDSKPEYKIINNEILNYWLIIFI